MKLKTLTVATSPCYGLEMLTKSLQRYGYDYVIVGMGKSWTGWKMKLAETRDWCNANKADYTHVLFMDAFDTFALGPMELPEADGIILSTEKNCWPDSEKATLYPNAETPYKYINAGQYFANIEKLLKVFEENPIEDVSDDQRYWTDLFLSGKYDISLDCDCKIFQSIAFADESDFQIDNCRIKNLRSGTFPLLVHGNGRTDMTKIYDTYMVHNSLQDATNAWQDTQEFHKSINEIFIENLKQFPRLNDLRGWVERNVFGFGERSFYYMWWLIVKQMTGSFSFLEIGVFRGQALALVQMIAQIHGKTATVTGVTPLDTTGGHWESDYKADIDLIHDLHALARPEIIKGLSTDPEIIEIVGAKMYDLVYIDGGHSYDVVKQDLDNYLRMINPGGYLIIDDCCNSMQIPWGFFGGIEEVTKAVNELLPPVTPNPQFIFLFSIVHNRVYRKIY